MRFVRPVLLVLAVALPLSIGQCLQNLCSQIPDQPHEGVCDPFRS